MRIYKVNVSDEQSSASSAAAADYDAANVNQVTVTANHIGLQLPRNFFASSAAYSVLLDTGNYLLPANQ